MPVSAFTTPFRLTWSMVRQRLPELHPEPSMLRLTTGLTKGSRRLVRSMCFGVSDLASTGFFWSSTAICCLGCDFLCAAEFLLLMATVLTLAGLLFAVDGWLTGADELTALACE